MRAGACAAVTLVLLAAGLDAHGAHPLAAAARRWTWDPFALVPILVSASVYATGLRVLWRRAGTGRGVRRWEAAAFVAGLAVLLAALVSPLAWLSSVLFSAHMTQHELLMLVAAPLLVFGQPLLVALWSVPPRWRTGVGDWVRRPGVVRNWRVLTAPVMVFALHGVVLWVWHVPVLYEAALDNTGVHALQHLSFVLTAALFWWGMVHGRYGRTGYGAAVLYVFLTGVHSSVLGALITVAPSVWYATYAGQSRTWQVDPLADQQLAGLLMWVPAGVVFILFGVALFAAWLGEAERRARLGSAWVDPGQTR